jgi:microcystin degradation protein MlrC
MTWTILTASLSHETNTFSIVPTTLEHFRAGTYLRDNAVAAERRGTHTALGATFEAAEKYGWRLRHPLAASANPSGTVSDEAFEHLAGLILDAADGADGALLHLHGAMVTGSFEDAEGELLRRLRARLPAGAPIIVTLDLHANVTQTMATAANALIAVRTYPHIDFYERAWQGADLLDRTLRGAVRPRTVIARRPMLRGLDGGRTQAGPMRTLLDRAEVIETAGEALVVSVCAGFTAADIHDAGPSVTVTTDGALARGQAIAEDFMDHAWAERAWTSVRHLAIPEAMAHARAGEAGAAAPLVIADVTDNPGSGHYGDATTLLAAMLAAGLSGAAFYAIFDPEAVRQGAAIGAGGSGTITLGGRHDPASGGGPLEVAGRVVTLSDGRFRAHGPMGGGVWRDYGPSMLFRAGEGDGIEIAVIGHNTQATDLAQLTSLGIDVAHKTTIAVKSAQHFRAAFTPVAREIVTVDGGGLGSAILRGGRFQRVRRPIWPLDEIDR